MCVNSRTLLNKIHQHACMRIPLTMCAEQIFSGFSPSQPCVVGLCPSSVTCDSRFLCESALNRVSKGTHILQFSRFPPPSPSRNCPFQLQWATRHAEPVARSPKLRATFLLGQAVSCVFKCLFSLARLLSFSLDRQKTRLLAPPSFVSVCPALARSLACSLPVCLAA